MTMWIDTHCHLDAAEWTPTERDAMRQAARQAGVRLCVLPAVARSNWPAVRELAHHTQDAYALGIHPLWVAQASDDDLAALEAELQQHRHDPRLVAVGEIGLDFFVPELCTPALRAKQQHFYTAQLRLAQRLELPVIVHVRKSADALLHGLREVHQWARATGREPLAGIAHAFNGSWVQAQAFVQRGFALGFGGACTFEAARQLRRLACALPPQALVLETDAPDMPPQWLYTPTAQRAAGVAQGINSPVQLPAIAQVVAHLRQTSLTSVATHNHHNACRVLPKLAALVGEPSFH